MGEINHLEKTANIHMQMRGFSFTHIEIIVQSNHLQVLCFFIFSLMSTYLVDMPAT
jgi:hypothetical protein